MENFDIAILLLTVFYCNSSHGSFLLVCFSKSSHSLSGLSSIAGKAQSADIQATPHHTFLPVLCILEYSSL